MCWTSSSGQIDWYMTATEGYFLGANYAMISASTTYNVRHMIVQEGCNESSVLSKYNRIM